MRLYAHRSGYIPAKTMATFAEILRDIERLPELECDTMANCHAMSHAFANVRSDVTAVDGHFHARNTYHSWLMIGSAVIDVHPVAGGCPFIVDTEGMLNPWNRIYIPDPEVRREIDMDVVREIEAMIRSLPTIC